MTLYEANKATQEALLRQGKLSFVVRRGRSEWFMPKNFLQYEQKYGEAKHGGKLAPWRLAFIGTDTECLEFLDKQMLLNMPMDGNALLIPTSEISAPKEGSFRAWDAHMERENLHLTAHIRRFGLLRPILLNQKKFIVDGYRRFFACQDIGLQYVPATFTQGLQLPIGGKKKRS